MAESLASKVGRIVSGGFHALVDAVEAGAPESTLEQAIREVDGAIDDVRAELGRELARQHLAQSRLAKHRSEHAGLEERIQVALAEEREDLAEAAVSQQLDIEAQIPVLERTLTDCGERQRELEGFIAALQAKRRQMRDELRSFREAQQAAASESAATNGSGAVSTRASGSTQARVDRASSAFERVLERVAGVPAGAPGRADPKLGELEDLTRSHRIKERIALAKARAEER